MKAERCIHIEDKNLSIKGFTDVWILCDADAVQLAPSVGPITQQKIKAG